MEGPLFRILRYLYGRLIKCHKWMTASSTEFLPILKRVKRANNWRINLERAKNRRPVLEKPLAKVLVYDILNNALAGKRQSAHHNSFHMHSFVVPTRLPQKRVTSQEMHWSQGKQDQRDDCFVNQYGQTNSICGKKFCAKFQTCSGSTRFLRVKKRVYPVE